MTMLKVYETVERKVNVSDDTIRDLLRQKLLLYIAPGEFVSDSIDGRSPPLLEYWDEHPHGSSRLKTVREATEFDKAVYLILRKLDEETRTN